MRRLYLLLLSLLFSSYAFSGDGFRFRYIDLPATLRDANISEALTDNRGMLWFFTSSGLHRYDGNQLLTFNLVSQPSIVNTPITRLYIDRSDRLWIGTQNGITCFDLKSWTTRHIRFSAEQGHIPRLLFIRVFFEASDGSMYAGTRDGKLYRILSSGLELVTDLMKDNPIIGRASAIEAIGEPVKGQLWLTFNGGFVEVRKNGITRYNSIPGEITRPEAFVHAHGKILFYVNGARKGLYAFDVHTKTLTHLPTPHCDTLKNPGKISIFLLNRNQPAIFVNRLGFFPYNIQEQKEGDMITSLSENFSRYDVKSIWGKGAKTYFTFNKGIAEITQQQTPFRNLLYSPSAETTPNSIRCIYRHTDSLLYIGTYSEKFIAVNERTGEKKKVSNDFVYACLPWNKDQLLLGTEGNGLQWFRPGDGSFRPAAKDTGHLHMHRYVISLAKENDSTGWAGTYNGVFRWNALTGNISLPWKGLLGEVLRQSRVYDILIAGDKRYFSTMEGIIVYTPADGRLKRLMEGTRPDLALSNFYCCRIVGTELWAGTSGRGILILDRQGNLLREINSSSGLAGDAVYSLFLQGKYMVAGTDHGLSIIDTHSGSIRNYSRLDHLPSNEFNHGSLFAEKGRLYFGTLNGVTSFDITALSDYDPTVETTALSFTSFTTGTKEGLRHDYTLPYQSAPRIVVEPDVHYFSLRFGGVDHAIDQLNYYYRLKEKAPWQEIGRQREIGFAGLSPGEYRLQLASRGPGDTTVTRLLTLPLTVLPAWYETWWFRILCLIAAIALVWFFFWYRMQQLMREQRLRTKIAEDLHDEVGSSLTRIYFQADMLQMQSRSIAEDKTALEKIAASSKEALGVMSDMVWSIDAQFDTTDDLVSRIRDYINHLQNDLDISVTLELRGDYASRPLSQMIRQNFFLIFKEAVNNASRYTSGNCMRILLEFQQEITLEIINPYTDTAERMKSYQGGMGLQHMQARAIRMKGLLTVQRENGAFLLRLIVPF